MGTKTTRNPKAALVYRSANKDRRKQFHIDRKKASDSLKRDERFRRKREERKDPELRKERQARNKPITIDAKRKWDDTVGDEEDDNDMLGQAVDLEHMNKRKRTEELGSVVDDADFGGLDSDADSMLAESDSDDANPSAGSLDDVEEADDEQKISNREQGKDEDEDHLEDFRDISRAPSVAGSVAASTLSTALDLAPEALLSKFPTLFSPNPEPKVLVTTSLNSTLHDQARLLSTLFPNSTYIRRSGHRFSHKFSVTEIAQFASNRGFTTLILMMEDQKKPHGIDIVHLPSGPMFHFSITNWVEGKKLPGHGNPTDHNPELILRGFRTPLGVLTASILRSMVPASPELQGRQVVTFQNQRDFIFVRRHRYVFRDRRKTEKSAIDEEGAPMKGMEDVRVGLQELGPRLTMKLRRVDKGIQRRSGQLWEWKGKTDRVRTKFQL